MGQASVMDERRPALKGRARTSWQLMVAYVVWDDSQRGKQEFSDAELLSFIHCHPNPNGRIQEQRGSQEDFRQCAHYHLGLIQNYLMPSRLSLNIIKLGTQSNMESELSMIWKFVQMMGDFFFLILSILSVPLKKQTRLTTGFS